MIKPISEEYFLTCEFNTSATAHNINNVLIYGTEGGIIDHLITFSKVDAYHRRIDNLISILKDNPTLIYDTKMHIIPGSHYFSLRYGFRHVERTSDERLWSSAKPMADNEIQCLLQKEPVEFYRQRLKGLRDEYYICDGYHRAFAMIGRMSRGLSYIPFYQEVYIPFQEGA